MTVYSNVSGSYLNRIKSFFVETNLEPTISVKPFSTPLVVRFSANYMEEGTNITRKN